MERHFELVRNFDNFAEQHSHRKYFDQQNSFEFHHEFNSRFADARQRRKNNNKNDNLQNLHLFVDVPKIHFEEPERNHH